MKLNMQSVRSTFKSISKAIEKHAPEILTGVGVAGFVATTVTAVKVTPQAIKNIEEAKKEKAKEGESVEDVKLEPVEYVKCTWKLYLPVVVTGVSSIACVIGATRINLKRNAALVAACTLSENRFGEYKDKVKELLGEKKEQNVRDEIAKDKITSDPVRSEEIIRTGKGETLCYDAISGRYFYSDIDEIKRALNFLNNQLLYDESVSLNDLYDLLGLEPNGCGEDFGWNRARPGWGGLVEPSFSSQLTADGIPCVVLDFIEGPFYTGYSLHGSSFEA